MRGDFRLAHHATTEGPAGAAASRRTSAYDGLF